MRGIRADWAKRLHGPWRDASRLALAQLPAIPSHPSLRSTAGDDVLQRLLGRERAQGARRGHQLRPPVLPLLRPGEPRPWQPALGGFTEPASCLTLRAPLVNPCPWTCRPSSRAMTPPAPCAVRNERTAGRVLAGAGPACGSSGATGGNSGDTAATACSGAEW